MAGDPVNFDLSTVFSTVAAAIPDHTFLVWRDKRFSYSEFAARVDGVANYLAAAGLGCKTERAELGGHVPCDRGAAAAGICAGNRSRSGVHDP